MDERQIAAVGREIGYCTVCRAALFDTPEYARDHEAWTGHVVEFPRWWLVPDSVPDDWTGETPA